MALQEELKTQGDYLFKNRSYLPLIILGIGLSVHCYTEYTEIEGKENWIAESFEYICLAVSLLGFAIRVYTVGFAAKNTSGRNTKDGQIADQLNVKGVYSIVRHPLYVGNFFMWLGIGMLTENFWFVMAFILFYAFYYERIMYAEENFLRKKFGKEYIEWSNKVPAFIPSFKGFQKPTQSFDWKKVLKKEKNGIAAVFILFWFFEFIGDFAENGKFTIEIDFWSISTLLFSFIYLILKILKKRKVLD